MGEWLGLAGICCVVASRVELLSTINLLIRREGWDGSMHLIPRLSAANRFGTAACISFQGSLQQTGLGRQHASHSKALCSKQVWDGSMHLIPRLSAANRFGTAACISFQGSLQQTGLGRQHASHSKALCSKQVWDGSMHLIPRLSAVNMCSLHLRGRARSPGLRAVYVPEESL